MSLQCWLDKVCHNLAFVRLRGAWSAEVEGLELMNELVKSRTEMKHRGFPRI